MWCQELVFLLQVETVDDYDEYCHYVAGLVGLGLSKLFHAYGSEDLAPDSLSNSMGLFLQVLLWYINEPTFFMPGFWHLFKDSILKPCVFDLTKCQKTNIIRDYLEDINEIPKSRMFWPRQIWNKYVNKLEVCLCCIFYLNFYPNCHLKLQSNFIQVWVTFQCVWI